jgi:hypothetical protein
MATYTVVLVSGTLNLRASPSTSGTVLANIPNYETITGTIIIPYTSDTETADGYTWRSVEYGGKKGWVAAQYLTAGNVSESIVPARANGILNPTTDINPQNSNGMFSLTDEMKKKLKIGAIIIGVAAVGFGIYKVVSKKQQALPASTLSGLPRHKKRKTKKSKKSASNKKKGILNLN